MANFTLPHGWTMKAVTRKNGKTAGRVDKYYYSPTGKRYRSLKQVKIVLSETPRVWVRDPKTNRLVRIEPAKTVDKINLGPEVEEVFKSQALSPLRWIPSSAFLLSFASLVACTFAAI